ncbi:MAG TPA: hydrogenase maturation protease [Thermoplasmata archaeon]|jgi:hydrogenase maturation protease|nr:hydrogenase maturation protease [Thermoplasmata archaeon]
MSDRAAPAPPSPGRLPLIIGLGNDQRGDDGSGLEVARALRPRLAGRARIEECASEGIVLLDLWRDADQVLVIDAVVSGGVPGTVHRIEVGDGFSPGFHTATSTHGLSLAEAVALGQGLGCLPRHLVVYGIEVNQLDVGAGLSAPVARAVLETADRIEAEIEATGASARPAGNRRDA